MTEPDDLTRDGWRRDLEEFLARREAKRNVRADLNRRRTYGLPLRHAAKLARTHPTTDPGAKGAPVNREESSS